MGSFQGTRIYRHKTAIVRSGFSLPVKCLLERGVLHAGHRLLDYGCGRGRDLDLLRELNIQATGWDPVYRPDGDLEPADIVNLGYVINVIEDSVERSVTLRNAWSLASSVLVVAAQTNLAAPEKAHAQLSDGIVTSRGTFQKYYTQAELRAYIESELCAEPMAAAPGVYFVFRHEADRQACIAARVRRRVSIPKASGTAHEFERNKDVLEPLVAIVTDLGRLPGPDEILNYAEIVARFGSLKRAFSIIRRVTDEGQWNIVRERRSEDLLVYLALSRFEKRPQRSHLPLGIQRDIAAFFGSYTAACSVADALLFSISDTTVIERACRESQVGYFSDNGLYVRVADVENLGPVLRVYEGCARALLGDATGANVTKLHALSAKVSYLCYRDFDQCDEPVLASVLKVSFRDLHMSYWAPSADEAPTMRFKDKL